MFEVTLVTQHPIREAVMFLAQIIGGSAVVLALLLTIRALRLQRKALHGGMFTQIMNRIDGLQDTTPEKPDMSAKDSSKETQFKNWYVQLFNTFENLVFLLGGHYLDKNMERHYRDFIVIWCEKVPADYPDVVTYFKDHHKESFNGVRAYYEKVTNKKLPF